MATVVQKFKVIPSGHSSATWCYNYDEWLYVVFITTNVQKEWCVGFHYGNDKESHTFQQ